MCVGTTGGTSTTTPSTGTPTTPALPTDPTQPMNPYGSTATNPFYASAIAKLNQQNVAPSFSTGFPTMQQIMGGLGG
jgi:hypothetical protein